jgi:NarL family two-component system response regulator LiaR
MQAFRLLVVEYRALIRQGISSLLASIPGLEVEQADGSGEALQIAQNHPADVILMDIDLPDSASGIGLIAELHLVFPASRIIVLTNRQDPAAVRDALRAGALSYLLKSTSFEELVQAIHAARQGVSTLSTEVMNAVVKEMASPARVSPTLTGREYEVLEFMARGWNNQRIAKQLCVSSSTVQFHVGNILSKFHVANRTEAATYAARHQLLPQEPD